MRVLHAELDSFRPFTRAVGDQTPQNFFVEALKRGGRGPVYVERFGGPRMHCFVQEIEWQARAAHQMNSVRRQIIDRACVLTGLEISRYRRVGSGRELGVEIHTRAKQLGGGYALNRVAIVAQIFKNVLALAAGVDDPGDPDIVGSARVLAGKSASRARKRAAEFVGFVDLLGREITVAGV